MSTEGCELAVDTGSRDDMSADLAGARVRHVPEHSRYEIYWGGARIGLVDYLPREGHVVVTHTEIDAAWGGRGLGALLTRRMLDDLRARGLRVVPGCPFTAAWIRANPAYADLLA
ncbi:MAG: GNAT family N-acetyltransferase [Sporichthyaceae bacterium]